MLDFGRTSEKPVVIRRCISGTPLPVQSKDSKAYTLTVSMAEEYEHSSKLAGHYWTGYDSYVQAALKGRNRQQENPRRIEITAASLLLHGRESKGAEPTLRHRRRKSKEGFLRRSKYPSAETHCEGSAQIYQRGLAIFSVGRPERRNVAE